jgi:asparagine synthase (glutamine-hydrolysing)
MCGICGVVGIEQPNHTQVLVRRMLDALLHRGPDGEGSLIAASTGVGMRRLSIIDLPGGNQPVWNESGTLAIFYNGEIYNFKDLRRELVSLGHVFRTQSDTETVVHAYEAWGTDFLQHLRGMFAFALLEMPDGPKGPVTRTLLARDRMGIKPLYYAVVNGVFLFASEVRALLASGLIPAKLSSSALPSYLLFGSLAEPATLVEGIHSLPPGHWMEVFQGKQSSAPQPKCYWNVENSYDGPEARTVGAPQHLRSLLESSVREHLIADVPLGIFLSSGIDSTAIAALACRDHRDIQSFTVVFPEIDFSEAEIAQSTADRLGTHHRQFLLSGEETLERLEEALGAFDLPSMDGINTYFVSWAARQAGLKVALSGLGSDELFGGYPTFRTAPRIRAVAAAARFVPQPARVGIASAFVGAARATGRADWARKIAGAWIEPSALPHAYFFTRGLFSPRQARAMLQEHDGWHGSAWWKRLEAQAQLTESRDAFSAVSLLELQSYMSNTLLRDTDAMSMANSLEVRVPFLDHRLVEFALALPASEKNRGGIPKALLIEALGELLPREITARKKRTFTFPWVRWLHGPLQSRVAKSFSEWSPLLEPLISGESAQSVWRDFIVQKTTWSRPWSLFVLNEWVKKNLGSGGVAADVRERSTRAVPT